MSISNETRNAITATINALPSVGKYAMSPPAAILADFPAAKSRHYGLYREDTGSELATMVKAGYTPHTKEQLGTLAIATAEMLGDGCKVTACWHNESYAVIVAPSMEHRANIYGKGDNLFPRFILNAPFNRRVTFDGALYRDACKNLSIPRQVGASASVGIRHSASLDWRMDDLASYISTIGDNFAIAVKRLREYDTISVDVADFLNRLYSAPTDADSKAAKTRHENRTTAIVNRLIREARETGRDTAIGSATLYQVVQAVTGYIQHDKTRHGKTNIVGRALLAVDDAESDLAWDVAATLAS